MNLTNLAGVFLASRQSSSNQEAGQPDPGKQDNGWSINNGRASPVSLQGICKTSYLKMLFVESQRLPHFLRFEVTAPIRYASEFKGGNI